MKRSIWSIVWLGIIFSILNEANGDTSITSCSVTAKADRESLTINVTYSGDAHKKTLVKFFSPLLEITAITAPCRTSTSSTHLTFTSCSNSSGSTDYKMWLYYNLVSITNTNITVRKFNFPIQSQSYTDSIYLRAWNSSNTMGPITYCSTFSSPPPLSLLGKYIYIYIYIYIPQL